MLHCTPYEYNLAHLRTINAYDEGILCNIHYVTLESWTHLHLINAVHDPWNHLGRRPTNQ
jgi:hypothetical protein